MTSLQILIAATMAYALVSSIITWALCRVGGRRIDGTPDPRDQGEA